MSSEGGVLSGVIPTKYNSADPISLFIIQVLLIITFTRLLNNLLSPLKQPRVISEVIGGIILGPSVFGHIPNYMDTIFPDESKPILNLVANFGLVFFLFLIGVEMNPKVVMKNARAAISISAGGISTCFVLGAAVSYGLYTQFTDETQKFSTFLIFIGVAMSITAFPVLARILSELKLMHSPVGIAALTASVNDDVVSWILLALVVSLIKSSNNLTALYIFLLCIGWVFIVVIIIRPILLKLIVKTGSNDNGPTLCMMVITLSTVLISAFVTSSIGIHAIFGGFIIGVIVPHEGGFAVGITEKIEDLVNILFLPIYFTLSGLKTELGLLNTPKVWLWVFIVISCAMMGKICGAGLMARLNKYKWIEALTIGVFMSCKGLVELIVLNIGFDEGVINKRIFVIMVTMAIVTTFTTSPLATWIYSNEYQRSLKVEQQSGQPEQRDDNANAREILSIEKFTYNKFLVVLNKIEWLPSIMVLLQSLEPTNEQTSTAVIQNTQPSVVHVLRMVELTQRISTVMKKFNKKEEAMLHDPIINVFRMFGRLNLLKIEADLSIAPFQNFSKHIAESVRDTGSEMVIIPWNGLGAIIDDPSNPFNSFEETLVPREKKDTSPQVANFVQGVYNEVNANIGFLIDRGLGVGSRTGLGGTDIHVYLPFFGGIDNRAALSFVVRLLKNSNVTATVIRIKRSDEPTDNDAVLQRIEFDDSNHDNIDNEFTKMSSASAHVLNSNTIRHLSEMADELLLSEYFKVGTGSLVNNPRINYSEILSSTPLQTAVEHSKKIVSRKDLVVVGRERRDAIMSHREEFIEVLKNFGLSSGNDTRKCLGDLAEAFLVGQIASSMLVIQGKKSL
ncbi:Sodium/hydrogen exchanger family-domain-containing protein [Glomus cerebriforme]|uniref:Sodium/hydrogen exchanger family-domain-containing protein n=1 Tax=Glomus cerebriforme TaxID=658196 RepID=A0A397T319_9GLOM|nr:Sodium/hydrogen exchanger family-domain-containing protein [Glomus cerebriforme]